jgi:dihydropteroate synthase
MGVVNLTPDSFFDGGRYISKSAAESRVDQLLSEGAAVIDLGGESSRPGAEKVAAAEQIDRVRATLSYAVGKGAVVSIDTTDPEVADYALAAGAKLVNDVSCLEEPELAAVTARRGATLLLMHSRDMRGMSGFSQYPAGGYGDVVEDVRAEWRAARDRAVAQGLEPGSVWLDPGLGFAKNAQQSFELLRRLSEFASEGVPIAVGPSRKSFIAAVDGSPPEARLGGTVAACLAAAERGASLLRVHDVMAVRQALGVSRLARHTPSMEARHA